MIYILSSFDRNYVKYYKRFINCLASNFENNLGIDLGHRSVVLIGVPKGEFTNDEILDFYSFMESKGVQGKIIEVFPSLSTESFRASLLRSRMRPVVASISYSYS